MTWAREKATKPVKLALLGTRGKTDSSLIASRWGGVRQVDNNRNTQCNDHQEQGRQDAELGKSTTSIGRGVHFSLPVRYWQFALGSNLPPCLLRHR